MRKADRGVFTARALCAASVMAFSSTQANAQAENDPPVFADNAIVVTATKQGNMSVQDIPISVSVLTGQALEEQNVRSFEDVAQMIPSLQFAKSGDADLQLIIRGVQSPGVSTVGFYLDETVINGVNFGSGGGRTPDIGAYDIERIEVLKGPQGTLFGASSMSGTVRIITNKPDTFDFSGHVTGTISDTTDGGTNYGGEAVLNVPIVQDLIAARGVIWHEDNGGYIDGYFGVNGATFIPDANTSEKTGGRAMLRLTPSRSLTLDAFYTRQEHSVDGPSVDTPEPTSGVLAPITIVSGPPFLRGRQVPAASGGMAAERVFTDPAHPSIDNTVHIYGATAQFHTDIGSITATASNYDVEYAATFALTGSGIAFGLVDIPLFMQTGELVPIGAVVGDQSQDRGVFSSEIRFSSALDGPFNFVVGGSYVSDENETEMTVKVGDEITGESLCFTHAECIADIDSAGARSLIYSTGTIEQVESFTIFANGTMELTDRLTADAGIRYFRADLHNIALTKQAFQASIPPSTPPAYGGPVQTETTIGLDAKDTQEKVTWSGSLAYDFDPDKMIYARAATGFRQGGINNFNSAAQLGIIIPQTFGPDTVLNLELGAKLSLLNRRLTLNTAVFHMIWEDIQVPNSDATGAVDYIGNGTNARISGAEVELLARPTDALSINLAATVMRARLSKDQELEDEDLYDVLPPLGLDGNRIPKIPEFTLAATGRYEVPGEIFAGVQMILDASFNYVGKSYNAFNDGFDGYTSIGDYALLNLGINFETGPAMFRIFANNVTDTSAAIDWAASINNVAGRSTNRPRTIGLLARLNF